MTVEIYHQRDWMYQKYIIEKMDANAIGRLVNRDGKTIWTWLRKLGIPTRPRGGNSATWIKPGESAFKGKKHTEETKLKLKKIALADGRMLFKAENGPPFRGKKGADIPSWKGGVTPQRQKFYSTPEWKEAVKAVWKRDKAQCQKCSLTNSGKDRYKFDIHHIVSFACVELRSEVSNLVLLCEKCHYWVHSTENTEKKFIKEIVCS